MAARSDALVFFGATGDLAFKKIFPALQSMAQLGQLDMPVVAVTRERRSKEMLLARARESVQAHGSAPIIPSRRAPASARRARAGGSRTPSSSCRASRRATMRSPAIAISSTPRSVAP